jgi:serine protease Do
VIRELDGQKMPDAGELQVEVGQKRPGTTIKLGIFRDGKNMTVPVTLEAMGARDKTDNQVSDAGHSKPRWGIGLSDLDDNTRGQIQVPSNVHGAVVDQVTPGSSADDAGLQRGDVIVQVNRKDVQSAADVRDALGNVPKGQDALLLVWSTGGSTFRVLHAPDGM